jgi:pilus assembly protein Flp/PilA
MLQLAALLEGFKMRLRSDEGATAVEYGLLVALIAAVIVGVVATLGGQINTAFQTVSGKL